MKSFCWITNSATYYLYKSCLFHCINLIGLGYFRTATVFLLSTIIPSLDTTSQKNVIRSSKKFALKELGLRLLFLQCFKHNFEMILVFLMRTQIYLYLHLSPCKKSISDIQRCNNYRGMKLLSHTMKVWEMVVKVNMRRGVPISENQFEFRSGQTTTKVIHLIWRLLKLGKNRWS